MRGFRKMTAYKIAFFDIDGTLADNTLPHDLPFLDRIPISAQKALTLLKENGIEPVIATGRAKSMVTGLIADLGLNSLVSSNGQVVTYQGRDVYEHPLSRQQVEQIAQALNHRQLPFLVETKTGVYGFEGHDFDGAIPDIITLKATEALPDQIFQFTCHVPVGQPLDLALPGIVAVRVAPHVVNIHATDTSKATGIHNMLRIMNLDPSEAICFGDEVNDIEMFEVVGCAVAMGNAVEPLKARADYITDTVTNDGIFKACQHFDLF